ncbi:hypothetical protein TCAL_08439 [Tigriopus californicus]|uniref:Ig-like domain-containing protein n=1 Tax=Tigriopus californicus TaxID=6832 RepID=A0A553P2M4_TIGCA|nr:hypothetical protein TCAL_08439 [Tigriopus californicus]
MFAQDARSVILHKIQVPSMVLNGTLPYVILDCQYGLNQTEKDGLVLKWALNGRTIYQWIPPTQPQGLGALRGKINLDYDVSPNPFQRHRALYLYSPTTEMTGDYTCKVSTLQNEVTLSKKMVVYEPPKLVKFTHQRNILQQVNLTCMVDHAYPEPSLRIFHGFRNQR